MKKISQQKYILKLLSLFFAALLWIYVISLDPLEVEKKYRLVVIPPNGKALSAKIPQTINVKLKGARVFMRKLLEREGTIYLNLAKHSIRNKKKISIESTDIALPFSVEVLDIIPKSLWITLEKSVTKELNVVPNLVGVLPSKYNLENPRVEPAKLSVTGAKSVMRKITELTTTPVELDTLEDVNEIPIRLGSVDSRLVIEPHEEMKFLFQLKPKEANTILEKVKIRFLSSNPNFESKDEFASLSVLIPDDENFSIKASEVEVIADIPDGAIGQQRIKLKANLPSGVHLVQVHPEFISVRVKEK